MACDKCKGRGYILYKDEYGYEYAKECECVKAKNTLSRLKRSGLGEMLKVNTFERFDIKEQWQRSLYNKAIAYTTEKGNKWFCTIGCSGSGKTHICTAICNEFLHQNKDVRFMNWIEESTKIKQAITNEKAYGELIDDLKDAEVLYIDDFFKNEPTQADIKLAMGILNYRYNRAKIDGACFKTIISSERNLGQLLEIDEAIIGRIVEMSKEYFIILQGKDKNYRLKGLL